MLSAAVLLALAMQCAPTIHPDTSQDVARVESGFNPWAIGVVGQKKGIFPHDLNDAIAHVNQLKAKGKNYSVGLMQINQSNFSRYRVTPEQLFNPCTNLTVFEKIMTDCYRRGGSMTRALSCYYAGNFNTGQKPEEAFSQTSYIERIGYKSQQQYVVPSSKADLGKQNDTADNIIATPQVHYPNSIVRGTLNASNPKTSLYPHVHFPSHIVRGEFVANLNQQGLKKNESATQN
jgi:type IV secretion system protein VirB1